MIIKLYYSLAKFYFLLFVNTYRKLASEIFNVDPNVIWTRNIQSRRKTHYLSATGTFGLSWCYCVRFIYLGQIWVSSKNWNRLPMAWWRNGSASDSSSEGCVFKSRPGQNLFFLIWKLNNETWCHIIRLHSPFTERILYYLYLIE